MADTEISFKISEHDNFIVCHAVFWANRKQTANVSFNIAHLKDKVSKWYRTPILNDPVDILILV